MLDSTRSTNFAIFFSCGRVRRASRQRRLLETKTVTKLLHQPPGSNAATAPAKRYDCDSEGLVYCQDSIDTCNHASRSSGSKEAGRGGLKFQLIEIKRRNIERINRLRAFGMSGTLAYGFLNALYYGLAENGTQAQPESSIREIAHSLARIFAYTWAGSQLTKTFRIVAAIAMSAPVNTLIRSTAHVMNTSRRSVFFAYVLLCLLFVLTCVILLVVSWFISN